MPELPEVETIKRGLSSKVVGKKITDVKFLWEKTLKENTVTNFKKVAIGTKIESIQRRAKIIIAKLDNEHSLIFHMKMTGHLLIEPSQKKIDKEGRWVDTNSELRDPFNQYVRVIFWLDDDTILAFSDLRKFGYIKLVKDEELQALFSNLGPEPFSGSFNKEYLKNIFSKKKTAIKKVIMDQAVIAGIGNIYADEILFASGIHPQKPANKITEREIENFMANTQEILQKSIELKGTSTSDFRDTEGKRGGFGSKLKIYKKDGEECPNCKTEIQRTVVGGRGTHFCPRCQK